VVDMAFARTVVFTFVVTLGTAAIFILARA
jgi:hypothetical protein